MDGRAPDVGGPARSSLRGLRRVPAVAWALPVTTLGLLVMSITLSTRGKARLVSGVIEACGGWTSRILRWLPVEGGVAAMTFGHVVLGLDEAALAATRAHERVHVAQCERWGPYFLPAYAIASLWAVLRGGHPYRDNWFEREAHAIAGLDPVGPSGRRA